MLRRVLPLLGGLLLAACAAEAPTPTLVPLESLPKRLATVFISPTPDEAQRLATQAATTATPLAPPATPTPGPTAYIGVFLGEAELGADGPLYSEGLAVAAGASPTPGLVALGGGCPAPPDPLFGSNWAQDPAVVSRLACPIEAIQPFGGALQIFERGVMYYRPNGEVRAIAPGLGRYWFVATPPANLPDPVAPPDGLYAPGGAIGAVWLSLLEVRDALGWARTPEQDADLYVQRFAGGELLLDRTSGQIFVLYLDSTLAGPY